MQKMTHVPLAIAILLVFVTLQASLVFVLSKIIAKFSSSSSIILTKINLFSSTALALFVIVFADEKKQR